MSNNPYQQLFSTFDLEPIDPRRLRNTEGTSIWETMQGKRNRISIGYPKCSPETEVVDDGLVTAEDLQSYAPPEYAFYRLETALTLLPDTNCRFRSADFIIDLPANDMLPPTSQILRLRPSLRLTQKGIVREGKAVAKLEPAELPFLKIGGDFGGERTRREELTKITANLESFGTGTDSQEIPLTTTELEVLFLLPAETQTEIAFNVLAEIDVLTRLDQWLTWAFKRKSDPALSYSYTLPPSLESGWFQQTGKSSPPGGESEETPPSRLTRLRETLTYLLSDGELRTLCFDMGVDYENIPGEARADKARELIIHLNRRQQIPELIRVGRRLRPEISWDEIYFE
jgi:hypothetical protein